MLGVGNIGINKLCVFLCILWILFCFYGVLLYVIKKFNLVKRSEKRFFRVEMDFILGVMVVIEEF